MPISDAQQVDLLHLAKSHWIEAQRYKYAYERSFIASKRKSDHLKRATFLSAVLSASTTALQSYISPWPGIVAAIATGLVSAFDQIFAPTQGTQDFWKSKNDLDQIQRDLTSYSITIDSKIEMADGMQPLQTIEKRLTTVTERPFLAAESDRERAENEFARSAICAILSRKEHYSPSDDSDDFPVEMGNDAPNVVAAIRGRIPIASVL